MSNLIPEFKKFDMIDDNKHWYAVYTRPRWEKKVAKQMIARGIEHYCPLNAVQKQWSDRKKIIYEPLFSSYIFVRANAAEHIPVKQLSGVLNFVYWLKKPAVIKNEEIEIIKRFMTDYTDVQLEKCPVNLEDSVRIIGGPLMHREGNVLEIKHKTVKVILPSLGYTMIAEVAKSNIELVHEIESETKAFAS